MSRIFGALVSKTHSLLVLSFLCLFVLSDEVPDAADLLEDENDGRKTAEYADNSSVFQLSYLHFVLAVMRFCTSKG